MRFHQKCLKPVVFTEIDFASLDEDSGVVNVTIEGMGSFSLAADDAGNPSDIFAVPFGTTLIPPGADITV